MTFETDLDREFSEEGEIDRGDTGIRILFTLLFWMIARAVEGVLGILIIFQLLSTLITQREPSPAIRRFANQTLSYLVRVGRYIALGMAIIGIFSRPMILALPLIAAFIWWAGLRELWGVRIRHGVGPMMNGLFQQGADGAPGAGPDPFAFFRQAAEAHANAKGQGQPQAETPPSVDDPAPRSAGGFSDADIKRLERFRGPMDERK